MSTALSANVYRLILCITGSILLLASISTATDAPRRVLLLNSFEKGVPTDVFRAPLLNELRKQSPEPLSVYEFSVGAAGFAGDGDDRSILNRVLSTFKEQPPDLIVTLAGTAARFAQRNRDQLFPSTPLLFALVDERFLDKSVTLDSTSVAVRSDAPRMIETILQVLPETKNIVVVVGRSPLGQFWREALGREFQRFENQLTFTWFDNLSFPEMLNRSAALPANSAIFYVLLSIDATGISGDDDNVVAEFNAKANAPIFRLQGAPVGDGIVGGPLPGLEDMTRKTAAIARRLLKGEAPESIKVQPQTAGPVVFDWRELQRWKISEDRLPPGSIIRFRSPTAWEEYKWYVIVGGALFLFEFLLVVGLALNLFKRRRVERSLREAQRGLIQAQEAERSRFADAERRTLQLSRLASQLTLAEQHAREQLARTLHDGLQQSLSVAGIRVDRALKGTSQADQVGFLQKARTNINEAIEAARTLSVDLFPPVLHISGLPAALNWLARRTQEQYGVLVDVTTDARANPEARDVRIFLFEAVRELVFNAIKHAHADRVVINLELRPVDSIYVDVSDQGVGFDPAATLHHKNEQQIGLGLFSIRERLELLGGHLDIESAPGKGARFSLTLPRAGLPHLATDGAEVRHDNGLHESLVYDPANGTSKSPRILIADDHAVARAGLRELFSQRPLVRVVGEAANGVEAISQAKALQPDFIVMDVSMPQMNGIEATRQIHEAMPQIQIIGLSTYDDEYTKQAMLEAGAEAYFTKNDRADRLLDHVLSLRAQAKEASRL
jgi:signal transduction histidine kinase/ActR/RegA family two-component response regulator/ABC-type uncharacterized transport system substrate-binding protein